MFISQSLLVTVIGYEAAKRELELRSQALWRSVESRIGAFADQYDTKHFKQVDCDGTILCERQGTRHKVDCQGKTVPFNAYVRGLQ